MTWRAIGNAPGLMGPDTDAADRYTRAFEYARDERMADSDRLREGVDSVLAELECGNNRFDVDLHSALIGHRDDRAARALRLLESLESLVQQSIERTIHDEFGSRRAAA